MEFRCRLNNSLHYTLTAIDRMLLEIITCTNLKTLNILDASSKNNNINWELLRDNNDYNVYMSWDKERINGPLDECPEIRELFEQNKDFTRMRAGIICAVSGAMELLRQSDADEKESNLKSIETSLDQWLEHCRQIDAKQHTLKTMQPQLSLPLPSRIHCYLKTPYRRLLEPLVRLVVTASRRTAPETRNIEGVRDALRELSDDVARFIDEQNAPDGDCLWTRRAALEFVVDAVELLCVCSVLCAVVYELLRPMQQTAAGSKKNRKKTNVAAAAPANAGDAATNVQQIRAHLAGVVASVRQGCTFVERQLDRWQAVDLAERLGAITIEIHQQSHKDTVYSYVQSSHAAALKELKLALLNKCKLLNAID